MLKYLNTSQIFIKLLHTFRNCLSWFLIWLWYGHFILNCVCNFVSWSAIFKIQLFLQNKDKETENSKKGKNETDKSNNDSTKDNSTNENQMGADEAKKIVESITDSITNGETQECKCN
jgi:ATP-dependent Zn protease